MKKLLSILFSLALASTAAAQTNIPSGVPLTATTLNNAFNNLNVGNLAQFQNGATFRSGTEVVLGGVGVNPNDAVTVSQLTNLFVNQYTVVATAGPMTGNINLVTAPATIDGVSPATNACVLLTAETSSATNGLWQYPGSGAAFTTRCAGATVWSGIFGASVYTNSGGTNYGATGWKSTVGATGTVGVTPITFVLSSGGTISAGTNLSFSGSTLNVVNAPTFSGLITGSNGLTISSGASSLRALTATTFNGNSIPSASDTVALLAATQTLTNKSIAGSEINSGVVAQAYGGTGITSLGSGVQSALSQATVGSGGFVLGASAVTTVNGISCPIGSSCTVPTVTPSITNGSTTILSGSANGLLYNNAGVLGNLATGNNGLLVTNGSGAPSISSTLPSGLSIPAPTVTGNPSFTGSPTITGTITSPGTGYFFSQNGAVIDRLNDRLFLGGMTANDGAFPFTNHDWFSTLVASWGYTATYPDLGQFVVESENLSNSSSGHAIIGATQTLNNGSSGAYVIGVGGFAVCNNTAVSGQACEGFYGEAHRTLATDGQGVVEELDAVAHVPGQAATIFQQGLMVGIQDACGGAYTITLYNCDVAMQVVPNGALWNQGIVFSSGALASGASMLMGPTTFPITFVDPSGHLSTINSNFTTAVSGNMSFTNNGIEMQGHDGSAVAYFNPLSGGANWLVFMGAASGSSPSVSVSGTDTNVNLTLAAKGTGVIAASSPITMPTGSTAVTQAAGDATVDVATDAFVQTAVGGAGSWTTYTPTLAAGSGTFTTATATGRYRKSGKTISVEIFISITTNGTAATNITATLPLAAAGAYYALSGAGISTGQPLGAFITSSASIATIYSATGGYPGGSGNALVLTGTYETP